MRRHALRYLASLVLLAMLAAGGPARAQATTDGSPGGVPLADGREDYSDAARAAFDAADYETALGLVEADLQRCRRAAKTADACLNILNGAAFMAIFAGDAERAELYAREAVAIAEGLFRAPDPELVGGYSNLAMALKYQGRYFEAKGYYTKALANCVGWCADDFSMSATISSNLAEAIRAEGCTTEAISHYAFAMSAFLKLFPDKRAPGYQPLSNEESGRLLADGATILGNYGLCLNDLHRYAEAEPHMRTSLDWRIEVFGEASPVTALAYDNLALNLDYQGKHAEARPYHDKAVAILRATRGASNDTAIALNNRAGNFEALGDFDNATLAFREAVDIVSRNVPADYPLLIQFRFNLAENALKVKRPLEALEALRQAAAGVIARTADIGHDPAADAQFYSGRPVFEYRVRAAWLVAAGQ